MAKALITTDFPTPSEVASHFRIPSSRVAELNRQIAEMREADVNGQHRRAAARRTARKSTAARAKKK